MTDSTNYYDRQSITATAGKAADLVAHATEDVTLIPRAIMVEIEGAIITGYLENDPDNIHVTFPLSTGVMYAMAFKRITVISAGGVKGYK